MIVNFIFEVKLLIVNDNKKQRATKLVALCYPQFSYINVKI